MTVYFVLSGYLIGGILIRDLHSRGIRLSTLLHFWSRRWLRTLPAYFVVLTLLVLLTRLLALPLARR